MTATEFEKAVGGNATVVASVALIVLSEHQPLVPYAVYSSLVEGAGKVKRNGSTSDDLAGLHSALSSHPPGSPTWPQVSRDLLGSFLMHLSDLFASSPLIVPSQLAAVLAPLILRGEREPPSEGRGRPYTAERQAERKKAQLCCTLLCGNADAFFGERDEFLWGARREDRPGREKDLRSAKAKACELATGAKASVEQSKKELILPTKEVEVDRILSAGHAKPSRWYIVESQFVHDWLEYTGVKNPAAGADPTAPPPETPRPTKLDNAKLLLTDEGTKLWVVNPAIKVAHGDDSGDYRRVTKQVYNSYCNMYPGSGPAVCVLDKTKEDLETWFIDQGSLLVDGYDYGEDEPVMKRNRGRARASSPVTNPPGEWEGGRGRRASFFDLFSSSQGELAEVSVPPTSEVDPGFLTSIFGNREASPSAASMGGRDDFARRSSLVESLMSTFAGRDGTEGTEGRVTPVQVPVLVPLSAPAEPATSGAAEFVDSILNLFGGGGGCVGLDDDGSGAPPRGGYGRMAAAAGTPVTSPRRLARDKKVSFNEDFNTTSDKPLSGGGVDTEEVSIAFQEDEWKRFEREILETPPRSLLKR